MLAAVLGASSQDDTRNGSPVFLEAFLLYGILCGGW